MDKDFEDAVREKLERLYEGEEQSVDNQQDDTGSEEAFSANDLDDFLKKTEAKVTVKKEGSMPSPIFGNRDTANHNKYRVFVETPTGKFSFVFWDSIANTKANKPFDWKDALASVGSDISTFESAPSFDEFKSVFGYSETEDSIAQKAYNGCRKMIENAKKAFDEGQIKELQGLAADY